MALGSNNTVLTNTTALAVKVAQTTAIGNSPRLDKLVDVREVSRANNNILVYNAERNLYLLQEPAADGGSF